MSGPEIDLTRLGKAKAPEPRRAASEAAKRAALDAFGMAAKKNLKATQGTALAARLHRIATQAWSFTMYAKYLSGSALATLIIVPIAGIAAYQVMQREAAPTFIKLPAAKKSDTGPAGIIDKSVQTPVVQPGRIESAANAGKASAKQQQTDSSDAAPQEPVTLPNAAPPLDDAISSEQKYRVDEDLVADSSRRSAQELEGVVVNPPTPQAAPSIEVRRKWKDMLNFSAKSDTEYGTTTSNIEKNEAAQQSEAAPLAKPAAPAVGARLNEGDAALAQTRAQPAAPIDPSIVQDDRDKFPEFKSNSVVAVADQPVSTFSVDVDTSGYSALRRALNQGALPDKESVRIEEMVNYFPYSYAGPENATEAFKANVTVTPTPWNKNTKLLHVGIKGFDLPAAEQKPANLVFLLDVSGSMDEPDKLPLLKASFRLLVNKLKPTDTVSIVTYAGDAGIVLEPTKASEKSKILSAIDNLSPGGSTAGEAGINAAYALAQQAFVKDGVNRIMLATDGDFNVGADSDEDLKKLIEEKRKSGIFLSILGFGEGNYQDNLMQTLAQNGNGIAAYIDTLGEAEKVLVQEATASLFTIAKDVKIQVEFNPATISEYRLIGYETRHLNNEDFNNDRVDAGDIGSGHTVTAIYEMTPKGAPGQTNDPLRYKTSNEPDTYTKSTGEYAFVKIRYKLPNESTSRLVTQPVTPVNELGNNGGVVSSDVNFAIAVAAFGQKLRDEDQVANYSMAEIETLASVSRGEDLFGYRGEFLKLVRLAAGLTPQ
jgi:Ca-activated chloride channel homolog